MKTKYILKRVEYHGLPKLSDFEFVEENIDENLQDGEILTEAVVVSVDPYLRLFANPAGNKVMSFQAARVLKSKVDEYPKGSVVMYHGGWKTINKAKKEEIWYRVDNLLDEKDITRAVGVLGMPGLTAYIGFLNICKPKAGETVMVNASAGAVGSMVGQIAKIKGCKVIGCCGTDEKVAFCKSIGFDEVFNYKTENCPEALKRMAPNGIDCFYDNVGGQMASDIIAHMNEFGRISQCGAISTYNSTKKVEAECIQSHFVKKQLEMKGFVIGHPVFKPFYPEALKQMSEWIKSGKLTVRETITNGFENIPKAFIDMLTGGNIGKAAVKVGHATATSF